MRNHWAPGAMAGADSGLTDWSARRSDTPTNEGYQTRSTVATPAEQAQSFPPVLLTDVRRPRASTVSHVPFPGIAGTGIPP